MAEDDDEYEYYEEEYELEYGDGNDNDEWYYDETEEALTSPPKNVLEIIKTNYSQQLQIDPEDLKQEPEEEKKEKEDIFNMQRNRTRSRNYSYRQSRQKSNLKTKQSAHMTAINVVKGLFKNENLNQLPLNIEAEDLEKIAPILEKIFNKNRDDIPDFILSLFQTTIDNMFGTLNIDFHLLNNDYLYIKSVFVAGNESNNSSIKFERIMNILNNSKISTIQISNVHFSKTTFDNIINYIANDNNYDQENYLQNSVNQFIFHRKSGLKYTKIEQIYAQQFEACGWKMSFDEMRQYVIITLDFHASWEYVYEEDYTDEETQPQQQQSEQKPAMNLKITATANKSNNKPPSLSPMKSVTTPTKEDKTDEILNEEYEYYYEDENGNAITAANGNDNEEYDYYYEDEKDNKTAAHKIKPQPPNKPIAAVINTPAVITGTSTGGGLDVLGLPPPDSDEDEEINKAENKFKFLSEVLTKDDYDGKILFPLSILADIILAMCRMDVRKGQCIMRETEYGQNYELKFFVIEYGVFNIYQQGKKLPSELFSTSTFGETHLIYGIPSYVTIRAATNKCLVWCLNRSVYDKISWTYFHKPFKNKLHTKLNEFDVITTLGIGSFGKVLLVRDPHKKKKTYSLKKIAKNNVIQNGQQKHIMNERSVMALISHKQKKKDKKSKKNKSTFCCKLYGLYQDTFYLYFLMEPLLGGELFTLLRHNQKFSEKVARFYLSCIIVAFDHIHSLNIIYRDIKPENIMLTQNGYVKLVDYGLAKARNNSVTLCGTPEYLAPEVIQNYWQGFELDFWGLGILLYEMIYGKPPFQSYEQILKENLPTTTINISVELNDLIHNLLIKNPFQRLGTTANQRKGIEEIYQHAWFKDTMEWNALKAQKFPPPYVPDIENDEDASHFDEIDSDDDDITIKNETYINNNPQLYEWCKYF